MPFDNVHMKLENGETKILTQKEFYAIPIMDRVQLLIKGNLQFFDKDKPISPTQAVSK